MVYPIKNIRNFSELLASFDNALTGILQGETALSIQLRDLPVFKRVKQKIEQLPFLKEIFLTKSSRNHFVLKTQGRINGSEVQGLDYKSKRTSRFALGSVDLGNKKFNRETTNISTSRQRLLPPLVSVEVNPFTTNEEPPLSLSDVQTAITDAIEQSETQISMMRKLKLAILNTPAHRIHSTECLLKYFMFITVGSTDSKFVAWSHEGAVRENLGLSDETSAVLEISEKNGSKTGFEDLETKLTQTSLFGIEESISRSRFGSYQTISSKETRVDSFHSLKFLLSSIVQKNGAGILLRMRLSGGLCTST